MFGLPRILVVYAIAIPVALVLGYAASNGLSTPGGGGNFLMAGLVLFVLALPILLNWHRGLLIFFWNASFMFPFLPAQPRVWLLLAVMSLGISWLNGLLGGGKFLRVPELTRPLIFLAIVVFVTGCIRGGIGARVFGSASYGGKSYFYILGAIAGYFAFAAARIPPAKANHAAGIYFASGTTFVLSNLAFMLGPSFYFLFYLLPSDFAGGQIAAEYGMTAGTVERFNGVPVACTALICCLLMRWGIRGIFSYTHPWRVLLFVMTFLLSLLGGFRSAEILIGLILLCQFCAEGLWRTRFLPVVLGVGVLAGLMVFAFSDRMPLAAQRAVSFLPVKVDPEVRADAEGSMEWRLEMWGVLVPQIPKYLLVGKGYRIDPEELYFAMLSGGTQDIAAEGSMVAGDYHSGPLSTIIPLGLWGAIGFLWLLAAGARVLYRNYRYGAPALRHINTFFLAFFIAQGIFFFGIFGAFNTQLYMFTGLLGMSVSLNGGGANPAQSLPGQPGPRLSRPRFPSQYEVFREHPRAESGFSTEVS